LVLPEQKFVLCWSESSTFYEAEFSLQKTNNLRAMSTSKIPIDLLLCSNEDNT